MKGLMSVARWLFILCMPVLLISASIGWGFNSLWLYRYGFQKYGVSQTTGLAPSELEKTATALINYFNSSEEYVNITVLKDGKPFELFTREEQIHFKDVKTLVWLDYKVFAGSLIYALGYALLCLFWRRPTYRRWLAWSIIGGSSLTLALMLAAGTGALLDFNQLFLLFHYIAFRNEFWSTPGYMIPLFSSVFYDATLFCAAATLVFALALGTVSAIYLRKTANIPPKS